MLTEGGAEVVPDGYTVQLAERSHFFFVEKEGKVGIVSDTGSWLTPLQFDQIAPDDTYRSEPRVGRAGAPGKLKMALINRYGRQVTPAVYDDIRFDEEQIRFRRGTVKGFLNEEGKELIKPVPPTVSSDD